jgi:ribosomal protein S18 acetylase RimI-like enzyme
MRKLKIKNMMIEIKQETIENIDLIQPLWEKLIQLHEELSPHFKDRFQNITWDERKRALCEKAKDSLFEYVIDTEANQIIGYCISTIENQDNKAGEIDSIYMDESYRKLGIGKQLIQNAVSWFDSNRVETQKILVGSGNEQVLNFYSQFDFYPLWIVLQKKKACK